MGRWTASMPPTTRRTDRRHHRRRAYPDGIRTRRCARRTQRRRPHPDRSGDFPGGAGLSATPGSRWLAGSTATAGAAGCRDPEFSGGSARRSTLAPRYRPDSRPGILRRLPHRANVMYRYDGRWSPPSSTGRWPPSVIPLLDLGVLSAIWPTEPGGAELYESALGAAGDLPRRAAMIDRYAAASRRDLSASTVVCGAGWQTRHHPRRHYARSCAGKAPRGGRTPAPVRQRTVRSRRSYHRRRVNALRRINFTFSHRS